MKTIRVPHYPAGVNYLFRRSLSLVFMLILFANYPEHVIVRGTGMDSVLQCVGANNLSTFCIFDGSTLLIPWLLSLLIALVSFAEFMPLVSSILFYWCVWSFFSVGGVVEGGGQLLVNAALVNIIFNIRVPKIWHLATEGKITEESQVVFRAIAVMLIKLQLFVIYFQAAVSKFGVEQWRDGTELFSPYNRLSSAPPVYSFQWMRCLQGILSF